MAYSAVIRNHILWKRSLLLSVDSHVQLFTTPWTAACQYSLSFTVSRNFLKLMSVESVMPSNHLVLFCPLLLLPSIFPSRVFSNETAPYPSLLHLTFLIDLLVQTLGNEGSALEKMGWKGRWEWGLQDLPTLHCRGRHQELGFPVFSLGFISWGSEFDSLLDPLSKEQLRGWAGPGGLGPEGGKKMMFSSV